MIILIDLVGLFSYQDYVCLLLRVLRFLRSANKSESAAFVPVFHDFVFKSFLVYRDASIKGHFVPKIPE